MRNLMLLVVVITSLVSCATPSYNELTVPLQRTSVSFCYIEQEDTRFALYTNERRMLGSWSSFDAAWKVANTMQCPVAISSF